MTSGLVRLSLAGLLGAALASFGYGMLGLFTYYGSKISFAVWLGTYGAVFGVWRIAHDRPPGITAQASFVIYARLLPVADHPWRLLH